MSTHERPLSALPTEDAEVSFDPSALSEVLRLQLVGLLAEAHEFQTELPLQMRLTVDGEQLSTTLDLLVFGNCEPLQVVFRHRNGSGAQRRNDYYSIRQVSGDWQAEQTRWIGTDTDGELVVTAFHEGR